MFIASCFEQQQRRIKKTMSRPMKSVSEEAVHTQCCKRLLLVALCLILLAWVVISYQGCLEKSSRLQLGAKHISYLPDNEISMNLVTFSNRRVKVPSVFVSASVQTDSVIHVTDERYVSLGIDASLIVQKLAKFNTSSSRLLTLAKALGACYVRFGGTAQDALVFNDTNTAEDNSMPIRTLPDGPSNFTMTASEWDTINKFVSDVGWYLVFGLNLLYRNGSTWDPSNALSLMKYSDQNGYQMHLELGNEPDSFKHVFNRPVDPKQAGKDFHVLRDLMKNFTAFRSSILIGPDVTRPIKHKITDNLSISSQDYLKQFLKTGGQNLDVVSFHHYYARSQTATESDFIDPTILNSLQAQITQIQSIMNVTATQGKQLWLGEAGSSSGRGAPLLSDRYIAGFMWLDRLGLSAVHGVNVVIRQSFYKGNYAMIDATDYTPFPDYWLTLLYKRLVGRRVLLTSLNNTSSYIRIYAHCTKTNDSENTTYHPGAVTLYILNLYHTDVEVTIPQFLKSELHLYLLTPEGAAGLNSRVVSLNGKVLQLISDTELPELTPNIQSGHLPVYINTLTFGFVVIPYANLTICR